MVYFTRTPCALPLSQIGKNKNWAVPTKVLQYVAVFWIAPCALTCSHKNLGGSNHLQICTLFMLIGVTEIHMAHLFPRYKGEKRRGTNFSSQLPSFTFSNLAQAEKSPLKKLRSLYYIYKNILLEEFWNGVSIVIGGSRKPWKDIFSFAMVLLSADYPNWTLLNACLNLQKEHNNTASIFSN